MNETNYIKLEFPSKSSNEAFARTAAAAFAAQLDPTLEELGDINNGLLLTLLKILGIGLTGEIASSVCDDGGSSSLGKGIRMLSNAAVFYLSVPVFSSVIDLIRLLIWNS